MGTKQKREVTVLFSFLPFHGGHLCCLCLSPCMPGPSFKSYPRDLGAGFTSSRETALFSWTESPSPHGSIHFLHARLDEGKCHHFLRCGALRFVAKRKEGKCHSCQSVGSLLTSLFWVRSLMKGNVIAFTWGRQNKIMVSLFFKVCLAVSRPRGSFFARLYFETRRPVWRVVAVSV